MKNIVLLIIFTQILCYSQFASGSGTSSDPWLIRTAANLDSIRYYSGESEYFWFEQIADIDLGVPPWNTDQGWLPIGTENNAYSRIHYKGNGFQIKNLFIYRPDNDYIGLFGNSQNIEIERLKLSNVNITGGDNTGAISGYSTMLNVMTSTVSGFITGKNSVGGFLGKTLLTRVSNSYCTAEVSGESRIGGIIGNGTNITIEKLYSIGRVMGTGPDIGGLVGYEESSSTIRIFSYWNTETSIVDSSALGFPRTTDEMTYKFSDNTYQDWSFGNYGWTEDLDSLNNGYPFFGYEINKECPEAPLNLTVDASQPGGTVIRLSWNNPNELINGQPLNDLKKVYLYRDFETLRIYDNPVNGELINFVDTVLVRGNCTYKVVAENSAGKGILATYKIYLGGLFAWGTGSKSDPYYIETANHLYNVRYFTDIDSVYFRQYGYINLDTAPWNEGKGWIPIGTPEKPFKGNYQSGYINGMTINDPLLNNAGLFGAVVNADLQGIKMENANILGNLACGALAGSSYATKIAYCSTEGGTVKGNEEIGGLIGSSWFSTINSSVSKTNVEGMNNVGGFSGFSCSAIKDCYSRGTVKGDSLVAGFVAVSFDSTITNCYSSGLVIGDVYAGGFSAQGSTDLFKGCYWDIERSMQSYSSGGEGRTTMEMFSSSTYEGWDFVNIWKIDPYYNGGYPLLEWQYPTGIENPDTSLPKTMQLYQNYPNPFNPVTDIRYSLKEPANIRLSVFNSKGELIKTLFEGTKDKGMHTVRFDASGLNSGLYFYRLTSGNRSETRKMLMLK